MKNKENAVCISWVDPSIRNLFNILLKEKEKRGKKNIQLTTFRNSCYIMKYLRKLTSFRIHWRFSTILRTNKKVCEVIFYKSKSMYILKVYSIHYTLRQNTNVKKISFGQNKRYKKCHSFISNFLKHKVRLSKTVWDFPFSIPFRFY